MITHEEARRFMQVLEADDVYDSELLMIHKKIATYITQQEKVSKLLGLYQEKEKLSKNPYKNIDTKEIKPYYEWASELYALEEKIKALEEELK